MNSMEMETGEILARLAKSMYILPHRDGFQAKLPPALVGDLLAAMKEYDAASNRFDEGTRAYTNLQIGATDRSGKVQAMAVADVDNIIDLFAAGERPEIPPDPGAALVVEYSRILRALADLASRRLPAATRRACKALGERLIAGSHVMDEIIRQRRVWSTMLTAPLTEFEGNEIEILDRDNGVPVSASARMQKISDQMFQAGFALTRRVDEIERAGVGNLTFDRNAYSHFDWLFQKLEPLLVQECGASSKE